MMKGSKKQKNKNVKILKNKSRFPFRHQKNNKIDEISNDSKISENIKNDLSDDIESFDDFFEKSIINLTESEIKEKKADANLDIKLSEEVVNEKMKQAIDAQKPKNRKKSTIWSLILLAINIFLLVAIVKNLLSDVDDFNFLQLFESQGKKLWWLVGGVFIYIIFVLVQVLAYRMLIKNLTGIKSWKISYDVSVTGKYYDNVTPFAIGGQPMQIYCLAKHKLSAGVSTSIPLIKVIANTAVLAIMSVLFFVIGLPLLSATTSLNQILIVIIEILGVIGLIITILLAVFMFLICSGTLFTKTFISKIIRFFYKIKIVKNYRQTYRKIMYQVAEYNFSMRYLWNNKKIMFWLLFYNFAEILCVSMFSFIITMSFSSNLSYENIFLLMFICLTKYNLCQMASCYIPLPGGTGMMEISFIILFGLEMGNNIVWGLLAWRFLSYYSIVVHGFIHELIKIFKNIINSKKNVNNSSEIEGIETTTQ